MANTTEYSDSSKFGEPNERLTPEGESDMLPQDQEKAFSEFFAIDPGRDLADIKKFVGRVMKQRSSSGNGKMASKWEEKTYREQGWLKYSDEQIAAGGWTEDDFALAEQGLREERVNDYFVNISNRYESGRPVVDSIVRLDQEKAIADDLDKHLPVLIRGNWRLGKTTMVQSLIAHRFGRANSLAISMAVLPDYDEAGLMQWRDQFNRKMIPEVATVIAARNDFEDVKDRFDEEERVREEIKKSGMDPLTYLDNYFGKLNEKCFVSFDEVVVLAKNPERLRYLAEMKNFTNLNLAIVLHRMHDDEKVFSEVFEGFKTHYVRGLTLDEVAKLVRTPLNGTPIKFTDEAIEEIFAFSGGRPMEVQNVCSALFYPYANEIKNHKFVFSVEDIKRITTKDLWYLIDRFRSAIDTYKKIYERSMGEEERLFINRLVAEGEVTMSEVDSSFVQPLVDTTYVVRDVLKNVYRINGDLFRRVVAERILS